jgi:hypothetical protein
VISDRERRLVPGRERTAEELSSLQEGGRIPFLCECSDADCMELVDVSLAKCEEVRAGPNHFMLRAGHESPAHERVVAQQDGYVVVEKRVRHLELDLNKRLHPRTRQIRLDGVLCPVLDAYITDAGAGEWQSAIDIVLRRFAEYQDLECAFGRRAVTERAKGTLMERHSVDETVAFDMLRQHSRATNRKLVDVATAVVDGHRLLPKYAEARSDI